MLLPALLLAATSYSTSVEQWRQAHEAKVRAEDGWLSYAGLFWLHEGSNEIPQAGVFEFRNGVVIWQGRPLKPDNPGPADVVTVDRRKFHVIVRGGRTGIRVRDNDSKYRRNFHGLQWFPIRDEYHVVAKWVEYPQPKKVPVTNILGLTDKETSPGYAEFTLQGQRLRLEPVTEDDKLFFTFRDKTSGKQTYPAVRFLYADAPKDGKVILDFNLAHNPVCAFTDFATCPLPRRENILPVAIEAGELYSPK